MRFCFVGKTRHLEDLLIVVGFIAHEIVFFSMTETRHLEALQIVVGIIVFGIGFAWKNTSPGENSDCAVRDMIFNSLS